MMAIRWIAGSLIALALAVFVSGFFMDNFPAREWSEELNRQIPPEGSVIQWCREGWGTTRFDRWGISGISKEDKDADQRILIWGDSYVEAYQVDDKVKMQREVTEILDAAGYGDTHAIGVGESSFAAADWYFGLDFYQDTFAPVSLNVFIVTQLDDFYPDVPGSIARYVSAPELTFMPAERKPTSSYAKTMDFYYRWRLQALQQLRDQTIGAGGTPPIWRRLSLRLGPRVRTSGSSEPTGLYFATENERARAFDFALSQLKSKSRAPMLLVYCPSVPKLSRGKLELEDGYAEIAESLKNACERHGIRYLDMRERFVSYYESTRRFPRGFPSTRPSRGHFNAEGHGLVAQAIVDEATDWVLP